MFAIQVGQVIQCRTELGIDREEFFVGLSGRGVVFHLALDHADLHQCRDILGIAGDDSLEFLDRLRIPVRAGVNPGERQIGGTIARLEIDGLEQRRFHLVHRSLRLINPCRQQLQLRRFGVFLDLFPDTL